MLRTRNQIRVTQQGSELTARAGNPIQQRSQGFVAPRSQQTANMYGGAGMGGGNSMSVNVLPQGGLLYDTMLSGLLGENEQTNMRFYRGHLSLRYCCWRCCRPYVHHAIL